AEFRQQRLHLAADCTLEELPVGGEVLLAVVGLQAPEPVVHLGAEAFEPGHDDAVGTSGSTAPGPGTARTSLAPIGSPHSEHTTAASDTCAQLLWMSS